MNIPSIKSYFSSTDIINTMVDRTSLSLCGMSLSKNEVNTSNKTSKLQLTIKTRKDIQMHPSNSPP